MNRQDLHLQVMGSAMERIKADMKAFHPKALVLFGSFARYLAGDPGDHLPNDLDLMVVTNNFPYEVMNTDYGCPVELHRFTMDRMVGIARSLRYDSRAVALSKLYGCALVKKHAIDVMAAAMMLGPAYGAFGIEQIEINGLTDKRDYSIHRVLTGKAWWEGLCRYAAQRRGPLRRFSDKLARIDGFVA